MAAFTPRWASSVRKANGSTSSARPAAPGAAETAAHDRLHRHRGHRTCGHGRSVHRPEDHDVAAEPREAAQLDAHGAGPALGVGRPQHREPGGEAVAAGGRTRAVTRWMPGNAGTSTRASGSAAR